GLVQAPRAGVARLDGGGKDVVSLGQKLARVIGALVGQEPPRRCPIPRGEDPGKLAGRPVHLPRQGRHVQPRVLLLGQLQQPGAEPFCKVVGISRAVHRLGAPPVGLGNAADSGPLPPPGDTRSWTLTIQIRLVLISVAAVWIFFMRFIFYAPRWAMGVSICLPTCNRPELLRLCLESCVHQTHPPQEILVGDDSCDDRSAAVVEAIRQSAPCPVEYVWNRPSLGQAANVDSLFRRARGELI